MSLLLGPPHLIDGVIDNLDGVELVEGDGCIGQVLGGALDEGGTHIDADLADRLGIAAMCRQIFGEGRDGVGVLALGGEQHPGLVDIDKQRDVVVAAPGRGLVDGDLGHLRGVAARPRLVHILNFPK